MKFSNFLLLFTFFIATTILGCQSKEEKEKQGEPVEKSENLDLVKKPNSWIAERVNQANQTLNSSEAGKIVWQSMEAHGGLKNWFEKGAIAFQFDYLQVSQGVERRTYQFVDVWSNRAVHQSVVDTNDTFGWDGTKAWMKRNDTSQFEYDVRFWALTPYYFLGQPFIFDGEGVLLEKLADEVFHEKTYDVVKVSFEDGTGDAPDDYYINYYDQETHLLKVIRYIVSYPAYFNDGGHSPEKMMIVQDYTSVDGFTFPTAYETYMMTNLEEKVTDINVSNISFPSELKNTFFDQPQDAENVD